jgi:hypothetical protein
MRIYGDYTVGGRRCRVVDRLLFWIGQSVRSVQERPWTDRSVGPFGRTYVENVEPIVLRITYTIVL